MKAKHDIRQKLHLQLAELWRTTPELRHLAEKESDAKKYIDTLAGDFTRGEFCFVPLITERLRLVCHLDVLFFRRDPVGALITKPKDVYGGDLDNRLKVFFDALRVPAVSELPPNSAPEYHEQPYFYCLVQDDSLITKFQVESAQLLDRPRLRGLIADKGIKKHVRLVVKVTTRITSMTLENMAFVTG